MHRLPLATVLLVLALAAAVPSLSACEAEGQGGGTDVVAERQLRQRSGTVTLAADEGLVFRTGEHLAPADTRTADLIAYANGTGLDLKPGTPDGAMAVERPGGRPKTYAALAEVPEAAPAPGTYDMLGKVKPGYGATVLGNVTDGHARIRVTDTPAGAAAKVTVEYEAFWYE